MTDKYRPQIALTKAPKDSAIAAKSTAQKVEEQ